jgi:hypothetical protein
MAAFHFAHVAGFDRPLTTAALAQFDKHVGRYLSRAEVQTVA